MNDINLYNENYTYNGGKVVEVDNTATTGGTSTIGDLQFYWGVCM